MKQKQYSPLSVAEMAVSLYAVNEGYLDEVPVAKVGDFEAALHAHAEASNKALLDQINETGDFSEEIESGLKALVDSFAQTGAY
jgi:F-type H+-transporting ATPase subunit alpha